MNPNGLAVLQYFEKTHVQTPANSPSVKVYPSEKDEIPSFHSHAK